MSRKPCIVQQNDFGSMGSVLIGVCKSVCPDLETYINGYMPKFNVEYASATLRESIKYWPDNTIFVSVIDPGVGTGRRACVAKLSTGGYIVTPDNGTLTLQLAEGMVSSVREIDPSVNRLPASNESDVFHGRDIFAYCAARLAAGVIDFEGVGPEYPTSEIVTFEIENGQVTETDASGYIASCENAFGNIETNIKIKDFAKLGIEPGSMVHICIKKNGVISFDKDVLYHKSFGFAQPGEEILYNTSSTVIGLGLNKDSFAEKYHIGIGKEWIISIKKQ